MNLSALNELLPAAAKAELEKCCGATNWVNQMEAARPYHSKAQLLELADKIWLERCTESDRLEAFRHHPKIGDVSSLKKKFANTEKWASQEQAGVNAAAEEIIYALAEGNQTYEDKFGYIFIVCATGKSAGEMLEILQKRLPNSPDIEIQVAAAEQMKITRIRLEKLLDDNALATNNNASQILNKTKMSQITTHVLDTSVGKPGEGMYVSLQETDGNESWKTIASGTTNSDGRIADLLPPGEILEPGSYRMSFNTGSYYKDRNQTSFYPQICIVFTVFDDSHYHVPLLLNPFGYSTYRGS